MNPAQRLDFARFSSDALLACFRRERDILHALSPGIPVTTNFMATNCKSVDYWRWAAEVDVISNDNYLTAEATDSYLGLAMSADMARSLAGGGPWLLMEHSTSAVSWQPRNIAKRPGEMRRNSLAHVARGADGVLFFQWRASRFGVEKHHSAMLPQGGTGTRVWREVAALGAELASLGGLRGTVVEPDIALLWDWQSWWAQELDWRPTVDLGYLERVRAWHEASLRAGLTADFAHPEAAELSRYRLVVVPALYLTTERAAANLRRYVEGGGTLVVSCFSGIVDDRDRVYPGPYPGALRDVLGLTVEEWLPLRAGEQVALTWEEAGLSPEVASPGLRAAPAAIFDRLAGTKPAGELAASASAETGRRADGNRRRLDRGGDPGRRQAGRLVRQRPGGGRPRRHPARPRRRPRLVCFRPHRCHDHGRRACRGLRFGRPHPASPPGRAVRFLGRFLGRSLGRSLGRARRLAARPRAGPPLGRPAPLHHAHQPR